MKELKSISPKGFINEFQTLCDHYIIFVFIGAYLHGNQNSIQNYKVPYLTYRSMVGFSMGKGGCFPPWENCFCPLDQMRNTFLSWSTNTWLFFHFIFHFHSLSTMPQSPTIPPTTSSKCTNTLKTQTDKPNNKIFNMLSEHEWLTANVFSFIHKIQSKNT